MFFDVLIIRGIDTCACWGVGFEGETIAFSTTNSPDSSNATFLTTRMNRSLSIEKTSSIDGRRFGDYGTRPPGKFLMMSCSY